MQDTIHLGVVSSASCIWPVCVCCLLRLLPDIDEAKEKKAKERIEKTRKVSILVRIVCCDSEAKKIRQKKKRSMESLLRIFPLHNNKFILQSFKMVRCNKHIIAVIAEVKTFFILITLQIRLRIGASASQRTEQIFVKLI